MLHTWHVLTPALEGANSSQGVLRRLPQVGEDGALLDAENITRHTIDEDTKGLTAMMVPACGSSGQVAAVGRAETIRASAQADQAQSENRPYSTM